MLATIRIVFNTLCAVVAPFAVCLFLIPAPRGPQLASPSWSYAIAFAAPGTTGQTIPKIVKVRSKLDERFIVAWPPSLRVGVPENVVVRVAANDYENLVAGIDPGRKIKTDSFIGAARLEITLTSDSGLEIVKHHSDAQVCYPREKASRVELGRVA
jgi:hypothetical protein